MKIVPIYIFTLSALLFDLVQDIAETQSVVSNSENDADAHDSDDTEILMNSRLSSVAILNNRESSLENLQRFATAVVPRFGDDLDVRINRKTEILPQILRKYKNPAFDITKALNVHFADEPGLDGGGVTREYFHLLMKALHKPEGSLILFEGLDGHLVPLHNYDILSGGLFVLVGKIILHAVLNSCTGMPGLSPAVVAYLLTGNRDSCVEHVTLADIPDPVLQDKLDKVSQRLKLGGDI